uniref:Uncharacterized protein n=1 Tax=Manihot esculenta TaxID=3983 RepID=A0A2C9U2E6_MANES
MKNVKHPNTCWSETNPELKIYLESCLKKTLSRLQPHQSWNIKINNGKVKQKCIWPMEYGQVSSFYVAHMKRLNRKSLLAPPLGS